MFFAFQDFPLLGFIVYNTQCKHETGDNKKNDFQEVAIFNIQ